MQDPLGVAVALETWAECYKSSLDFSKLVVGERKDKQDSILLNQKGVVKLTMVRFPATVLVKAKNNHA